MHSPMNQEEDCLHCQCSQHNCLTVATLQWCCNQCVSHVFFFCWRRYVSFLHLWTSKKQQGRRGGGGLARLILTAFSKQIHQVYCFQKDVGTLHSALFSEPSQNIPLKDSCQVIIFTLPLPFLLAFSFDLASERKRRERILLPHCMDEKIIISTHSILFHASLDSCGPQGLKAELAWKLMRKGEL